MYSRAYKAAISLPAMLWVAAFLLLPYILLLIHSFWRLSSGIIVHEWNFGNYAALFQNPLYFEVLLRSAKIAASVMLLSLLLGYPLAYYLSFHAGPRKELLYQLVIVPLWVSYLVRGYAWKRFSAAKACSTASCNICTSRMSRSAFCCTARSP